MTQGLVHAVVLDQHGGAQTFDNVEQAQAAQGAAGALWLHFDYTDDAARRWIQDSSGIDPLLADALLAQDTRPRVSVVRDGLLIYLRGVNMNPGAAPEDMIAIRLYVQSNRIISTQKRGLVSVRDLLADLREGRGQNSPGGLVSDLVDRLTWYMDDVVARIEADMDDLEDSEAGDPRARAGRIAAVRRRIIVLRRYLAPQRDALSRLQSEQSEIFTDAHRSLMREAADRLQRLLEDLDMFRDHATLAHEDLQSRTADQLNKRMYVLSIITGLFLPLGFLTGLFGVNLGGIPGADGGHAFSWFVGILTSILLVCSVLLYRRRWF